MSRLSSVILDPFFHLLIQIGPKFQKVFRKCAFHGYLTTWASPKTVTLLSPPHECSGFKAQQWFYGRPWTFGICPAMNPDIGQAANPRNSF